MKNKIISLVLVITLLFSLFAVTANAEGEEFLSDVALVYEDTVEEARAAIAGTDWKLYEQNLNPKADYLFDDGVYLIYKTTTNVEEAITDLRVMDMYGGFSISNYEKQLEKSRDEYKKNVKELRTIAAEFKALYDAGDEMARLAHRQMNYYKDTKTVGGTETDMLMGDFFLNLPTDDLQIVQVLLEGNSIVISNLFRLLAIGLSKTEKALAERILEKYAIRDTLTDEEYYDNAVVLAPYLKGIAAKIKRYDTIKDKYDVSDEEISEEEVRFAIEVGTVANLAESITLGDTTLAGMLREDNWTYADIYPIVAAFSEAQMSLIKMGAFEILLNHSGYTSSSVEDLTEMVEKAEAQMMGEDGKIKPIDVYVGVDRAIFRGAFAMTSDADRQQALSGDTWGIEQAALESSYFYVASAVLAYADLFAWVGFGLMKDTSTLPFYALGQTITTHYYTVLAPGPGGITGWQTVAPHWSWNSAGVYFWGAIAIALIAVGLSTISTWYNYYNPDYTEIPDTMIDVKRTDLGDKYVKYTAAKVHGDDGKKNADFNAYEGKEWIALYYTKDATAGNCLTPNFVHSNSSSSIARRHQGISMFGEFEAFNLNSHAYNKNAPGVYLTVRYSTTKKAAADIPPVIGSMFISGTFYTLTALGGAVVGMSATLVAKNLRKKKTRAMADANPR